MKLISEMCEPGSKRHSWCRDRDCECLCHGPDDGEPAVVAVAA